MTERWAPEIGVAIIAISADRPLSEGEIMLIKEAEKYSPHIVILLTKVDLFYESQIKEIVDFIDNSLHKVFDRKIPVYRFSSKKNSNEYRDQLVKGLFIPLISDFGAEFDKIVRHRIYSIAKACLSYLSVKKQNGRYNKIHR
jgi:UDP-glucose 6-dehydrogenase